jgi:hypothetical protein
MTNSATPNGCLLVLPDRPSHIETAASEAGYALLLVIWAIGIISLLALSFLGSVRYRVMAAANILESARAEALSEAGVNLAKLDLVLGLARGNTGALCFRPDGPMVFCTMPEQGVAGIVVEDEGGKVDLNAAPPKLLAHMLNGFRADAGPGGKPCGRNRGFRQYRDRYRSGGRGAPGICQSRPILRAEKGLVRDDFGARSGYRHAARDVSSGAALCHRAFTSAGHRPGGGFAGAAGRCVYRKPYPDFPRNRIG